MKNLRMAAGAALMTMCFALPANATTFDFFWTGSPLLDSSILSSDDPTATAMGTLDINVANGATFTSADVSNIDIDVKGDLFTDFKLTSDDGLAGSVAADGATATFTDALFEAPAASLQCNFGFCRDSIIEIIFAFSTDDQSFIYSNPQTALSSFRMTAQPSVVPVPAALPLLGTGMALMGMMGWRRKKTAKNTI